jgi:hypothetical protein
MWLQLSMANYGDKPEGNGFTLELQLGEEPVAGKGSGPGSRLYGLLTDKERLDHLAIHNRIMAKVAPNPVLMQLSMLPRDRAAYLPEQQPRANPFGPNDDPWFRYTDAGDIRLWLDFIGRVLPGAIARFVDSATANEANRPL